MKVALCSALLAATVVAQSTFSPARPPAIPIAVSNPYLNSWLEVGSDGGNGGYLAGQWVQFWANQITGWTGVIRVDNTSYTWMGAPDGTSGNVNQNSFEYTSTKSMFSLQVSDAVGLNVTFLSPVTPDDVERQSIAGTYMNVEIYSIDGQEHDIQLYTDVSAEWASGDRSNIATWDYGVIAPMSSKARREIQNPPPSFSYTTVKTVFPHPPETWSASVYHATGSVYTHTSSSHYGVPTSGYNGTTTSTPTLSGTATSAHPNATSTVPVGGIAYHRFHRQDPELFVQINDQAEWGNWTYSTANVDGLTYSNGESDVTTRGLFISTGVLDNAVNTTYRAIQDEYPVFAFAVDYGSVGSSSVETLFTINLSQQWAIQFEAGTDMVETLPPLWASYYDSDLEVVQFYYEDWTTAQSTAYALDDQVMSDSVAAGGSDYNIITSLSVRQAFAATQLAGTPDTYYLFLKEISSDGDIQTVDVIFPTMPIFLYFNPTLLKNLLDPIFIYTEAGLFPNTYALHDLGFYPNATEAGTEMQQLEESGNMVIMTLAYAQRTGDTDYLSQHYDTLNGWTQYLVNDSLIPENQISTDDFAGSLANQTNLAIKGIIGIEAMATIANMTNHTSDGANYTSIAHSYISQWQTLAIANDSTNFTGVPHTTLEYGAPDTYSLLYNLYADALLNTQLVPRAVYQMQSDFYPVVNLAYGVPLDTRHTYTKSDWKMFCAAIAAADTKAMFVGDVARYIDQTPANRALPDWYDAITGDWETFTARPVVGGHFALLALNGTSPLDS